MERLSRLSGGGCGVSFQSYRIVKAGRKAHRCDSCRQTIEVGQPSLITSGTFDGDFNSWRVHPECDALWQAVFKDMQCDYYEGMEIDTLEALGLGRDEFVPVLTEYAKEHPVAVERLMVTVRKWIKEDAE